MNQHEADGDRQAPRHAGRLGSPSNWPRLKPIKVARDRQLDGTVTRMQGLRHCRQGGQIEVRRNRRESHQQAQDREDAQPVPVRALADLGAGEEDVALSAASRANVPG